MNPLPARRFASRLHGDFAFDDDCTRTPRPSASRSSGARPTRGSSRRWSRSRPTRLPPGSVVDVVDRDGQWVGRGFYNGHSRITLRVLTADPRRGHRRRLLRPQHRPGRRPAPRLARPRRRHRRLPPRPLRGRRPERAGRRSLRRDARAGVLRGRHVPLPRGDPGGAGGALPRTPVLLVRRGARPEAGVVRLPAAGAAAAGGHHRARRRASASRPGSKHKTGFFLDQRDNRQLPGVVLRGQARARPVLQHRRLRRLRQGAAAGPRRWSASTSTSRRWRWPGRTPG